MAHLHFSFTFKGKLFCLCCTVKGTSIRHYKEVSGEFELTNPDFNYWDSKTQRFVEPSLDAISNNNKLCVMLKHYQDFYSEALKHNIIPDGKSLFTLEAESHNNNKEQQETLEDFIQRTIDEKKNNQNKKPSKSYQLYITLLHKLQQEGKILKKNVQAINNQDFISFGDFILNRLSVSEGRYNYLKLMKMFKAVHSIAYSRGINSNILCYNYIKDAPTKNYGERTFLTEEQIIQFCLLDLSCVTLKCTDSISRKELYRDFCIFLYETKMRPCDVLKLKSTDIAGNTITYIPEKKKNYMEERKKTVRTCLTMRARAIYLKYRGLSSEGYVFPFSMNNQYWDFSDAGSWNRWNNRKQKTLEDINSFLHKVEPMLGVQHITLYTFRHSAFTNAINSPGCNLLKLAKEGGTSIKMLEEHYYHLDSIQEVK